MNRLHHWYCNREAWKRHVRDELVPSAIAGIELGDDVLEVGPGFGPATEVLSRRAGRLTALEIDPLLADPLRARLLRIGDTKVLIDPDELPGRLRAAGFADVDATAERDSFRYCGIRSQETIDTI